jgi:hypothetical protein
MLLISVWVIGYATILSVFRLVKALDMRLGVKEGHLSRPRCNQRT